MNRIFANFHDILRLSKELLSRLQERMVSSSHKPPNETYLAEPTVDWDPVHDAIGDLLVPIAPFLKMYSLFMQNFSNSMQCIENEQRSNERFRFFLREATKNFDGASSRGTLLGLEAQLLSIVQRVPRYRLLLHALLQNTPLEHKDHPWLSETYAVVDHIATFVNEHVRQHELTLAAITLQRTLIGLDEPLVIPGRRLIKYGTLLKTRRKDIQPRRFYLFSDCLIIAAANSDISSLVFEDESQLSSSKLLHSVQNHSNDHSSDSSFDRCSSRSTHGLGGANEILHLTNKLYLSDMTVISYDEWPMLPPESLSSSRTMPSISSRPIPSLRHKFEILSPQCSFSLYASTKAAKDSWVSAIRDTQSEFQTSLPSIRKSSELSERPLSFTSLSSDGTIFDGDLSESEQVSMSTESRRPKSKSMLFTSSQTTLPSLEDYHAPVWVPDSLVKRCKRCSEPFSIWRRKHHCRLCGNVFCASCCSGLFLLRGTASKVPNVRARVCVTCYTSNFCSSMPHTPTRPRMYRSLSSSNSDLLDTSVLSSSPLTSPTRSNASLRPVLHALPESTSMSTFVPSSPSASCASAFVSLPPLSRAESVNDLRARPKSVLSPITNAPAAKPSKPRRRKWSIVSVPDENKSELPRVQVETKTVGLPTLEQHIPFNGMVSSASTPALTTYTSSHSIPRRNTSRESLRTSQAVTWLQSVLRT